MAVLDIIAHTAFWTCLALTFYAYALYPVCIWLLAGWFPSVSRKGRLSSKKLPHVTLIVAAHNEQAVIENKIRNSLELDYPPDRLKVVIGSDGSSDATPDIVSAFHDRRVLLLDYAERRGKSCLLNSAIAETGKKKRRSGEILVLSDANTEYQLDAIKKLVRWFADPRVDAVCGHLQLVDPVLGNNVDGLYWRYETFLKTCEGKLGALLGANGGIYAIRRSAYVPIPNNTIIDDFAIPLLSKLRHKGRIVYDPQAVAVEETPPTIGDEFRRRVRIGTGAYQTVPLLWKLLSPCYGWTAFTFLSHKILRWLVPFCLLGMLVSNLLLSNQPFFQLVFAGQLGIYAVSLAGAYLQGSSLPCKLIRALTMFVGMNLALMVGFWRWLISPQTGTWYRTSRKRPPEKRKQPVVVAQAATLTNSVSRSSLAQNTRSDDVHEDAEEPVEMLSSE